MSRSLNATGRPILYSMCNWGEDGPWNFATVRMPSAALRALTNSLRPCKLRPWPIAGASPATLWTCVLSLQTELHSPTK